MIERQKIVAYAYKYRGEYHLIARAIQRKENIELVVNDENCLVIGDEDYPRELYQLENPPFVLFYKGNLHLLKERRVAVVGSRQAIPYSLQATSALCQHKLKEKVVVSGLAKGIDSQAHQSSLRSIGILGCGIDYFYPACNQYLIQKMAEKQLILSEYPSVVKPFSWHFPFRNRLIAALSEEVYIMQSSLKSGTMTTVNEALKLGKEIYVLPHSLLEDAGEGNNFLLSEGANFIYKEDLGMN